jgi:hypothetical protein
VRPEREAFGSEATAPDTARMISYTAEDSIVKIAQERERQRPLPELAGVDTANDGGEL